MICWAVFAAIAGIAVGFFAGVHGVAWVIRDGIKRGELKHKGAKFHIVPITEDFPSKL